LKKPTLSGDAKVQKPNIPDGSRNGEDVKPVRADEKNPALSVGRKLLGSFMVGPHPARPVPNVAPMIRPARPTLAEVPVADLSFIIPPPHEHGNGNDPGRFPSPRFKRWVIQRRQTPGGDGCTFEAGGAVVHEAPAGTGLTSSVKNIRSIIVPHPYDAVFELDYDKKTHRLAFQRSQ
jgi:hypothetical protein